MVRWSQACSDYVSIGGKAYGLTAKMIQANGRAECQQKGEGRAVEFREDSDEMTWNIVQYFTRT